MEPNCSIDSPQPESMATSRTSPPIIVGSTAGEFTTAVHVPRKATRPPLATASQSSSMSAKGDQSKSGGRRLEKQSEVEDSDAFLQTDQQLVATSPTSLGGVFAESSRTVVSLDVPGRAASFDSSSLTSNGSALSGTIEKQHSLERPARLGYSENSSPVISRDSSTECNPYTDYTGADLEAFIRGHLNKSAKDREVLMSIEQRLSDFVKQGKTQCYSFPQMSSYHRMFVHRVSAYFGLDHNVDQTGKAVIVSLTPNTRLPDFKFRDLCTELPSASTSNISAETKKLILKRDSSDDASRQTNMALENTLAFAGLHGGTPASSGAGSPRAASVDGCLFPGPEMAAFQTRSFEEREADYQKARRRIFNDHEQQATPNCLGSPSSNPQYSSSIPSWGSTDNPHVAQGSISGPYIAKANSFGGTSVHPPTLQQQPPPRTMPVNVTQGSNQQNVTSSPSTLVVHQRAQQNSGLLSVPKGAVYVLAPSVDYVTAGSVVVNPQTGEAFQKRSDGSLQPVVLATAMNASPTNAGSPVQSTPSSPPQPGGIQYQVQSAPPPPPPPPSACSQSQSVQLSRFLVTNPMPSADSQVPQQYTIVGQGQGQSSEISANLPEVLNRLSIVSSSDLPQFTTMQTPAPSSQFVSQGQPIVLTSSVAPPPSYSSTPQTSGSFAAPFSPYQISTNGHYIYQVAPGTSLLTGPPNQSPQTSEVGSPQLPSSSESSSPHPPQQQTQPPPPQCWILTNPTPSGANPSDPSSQPRQVVLIPAFGSPFPSQPQPSQQGQQTSGPGVDPNYPRGQTQSQGMRGAMYGVYPDQSQQPPQQAQQQPQSQQHQSQAQALRAFAAANPPPPVPPRQVPGRNPPQQFMAAQQNNLNE